MTYCTAWADYVDLYHAVQETGWTVPTGDGGFKRNPKAASLRDAHERLRSAASEFGMTLSALVRLATPGGPVDDPLDELEKRRSELEESSPPSPRRHRGQAAVSIQKVLHWPDELANSEVGVVIGGEYYGIVSLRPCWSRPGFKSSEGRAS